MGFSSCVPIIFVCTSELYVFIAGNKKQKETASGFQHCLTALTTWMLCPALLLLIETAWVVTRRGPSRCGEICLFFCVIYLFCCMYDCVSIISV